MIWIACIAGGLVGLLLLMALAGWMIPKGHSATRRATFRRPASEVWAAITDIDKFPTWRSGIKSVERLPDREGRPAWKEVSGHGPMTLERVEARPPSKLVGRIVGESAFGGTWTYQLTESDGATTLAITEDGEIYNLIFRFMAHFILGYTLTMENYLRDLSKKFGEDVQPVP